MDSNSNVLVEYVGLKDREVDCVAGTGLVWIGLGSRHWVPAKAWETMKKHTDVWKAVEPEPMVEDPVPAAAGVTLGDSARAASCEPSPAPAPAPAVPPSPAPPAGPKLTPALKASVAEMRKALTEAGQAPHPRLKQTKLRELYAKLVADQARAA